jgi:hypothetical protein
VSPYFSPWSLRSSLAALNGLWLLAQLRVTADENIAANRHAVTDDAMLL